MAKRRANGEGSLRRRPNGLWELTIKDGFRADGKPMVKSFYGRTQKEVKEKLKEYRESKLRRRVKFPLAFREGSDLWYARYKSQVTPTTYEGYRYTLRILQEYFGDTLFTDILPINVEDMLHSLLAEGRSQSAVSGCRGMLHQIMGMAVANGVIDKNPVDYAMKMRYSDSGARREAFTEKEVDLLINGLQRNKMGMSILLLIFTGMRMQELLALEPQHISLDGSRIVVEQAVKLIKGTVIVGDTKTEKSNRVVLVPPNVRQFAVALRNTGNKYIWEVGKKDTPCNPSYFRDKFKETIAGVEGVRVLTPHSCRHTFVSLMIAQGVDPNVVMMYTGHTQRKMVDHYTHVQNSAYQNASDQLAAAFPVDKPSDIV